MENNYSHSSTACMSTDVRQLEQAFLLAKRKFNPVIKSTKGNFGKYANLEDVYNAVEDALMDNNINIRHFRSTSTDGLEILHTRLIHTLTGQFCEDSCFLIGDKPGNQERGKAITYMKRYAVLTICAIPTEDDDAQSEQKYNNENVISNLQKQQLEIAIKEASNAKFIYDNILKFNKVDNLSALKASSFESVMNFVKSSAKI